MYTGIFCFPWFNDTNVADTLYPIAVAAYIIKFGMSIWLFISIIASSAYYDNNS